MTNGQGNQTYYVYGLGLIGQEQNGAYTTYHFDLRGSTVTLSDESDSVTDHFQYAPYGELGDHTGDTSTPFLYSGKYGVMTDANGLYYMRARYYNPEIRRFVNQDILLGNVAKGQSLNRYAYVNGQPIQYADPFGLCPDRTAEAMQLLRDNAKTIQNTGLGISNPLIIWQIWYGLVKPGGKWDYKRLEFRPDWMPQDGKFLVNGEVVTAEAFGNINYGYTGTAVGFGEKTLFTGGGWAAEQEGTASENKDAPLYGDSQEDHDNIQIGIDMYYKDNPTAKYLKRNLFNVDIRPVLDRYTDYF